MAMVVIVKESNGHVEQSLDAKECTEVGDQANVVEDCESSSLLPPRKGGMFRSPEKIRRKVQWNDKNGNKLAEVLEYQPSEVSDTDGEDSDACPCTIM